MEDDRWSNPRLWTIKLSSQVRIPTSLYLQTTLEFYLSLYSVLVLIVLNCQTIRNTGFFLNNTNMVNLHFHILRKSLDATQTSFPHHIKCHFKPKFRSTNFSWHSIQNKFSVELKLDCKFKMYETRFNFKHK